MGVFNEEKHMSIGRRPNVRYEQYFQTETINIGFDISMIFILNLLNELN